MNLVGGTLKLTMGAATYTLILVAEDDFAVEGQATGELSLATGDSVSFKIANKPGVKISSLMSEKKVENLTYIEEQTEPVHFAVAVPKPY